MKTFSVLLALCEGIHRWPASDAELWYLFWSAPEKNSWANNRDAGDLRRYRSHYDVAAVICKFRISSYRASLNITYAFNQVYGAINNFVIFKYYTIRYVIWNDMIASWLWNLFALLSLYAGNPSARIMQSFDFLAVSIKKNEQQSRGWRNETPLRLCGFTWESHTKDSNVITMIALNKTASLWRRPISKAFSLWENLCILTEI